MRDSQVPEKMRSLEKPFWKGFLLRDGSIFLKVATVGLVSLLWQGVTALEVQAGEPVDLRSFSQQAIALERANGNPKLAAAMEALLPGLLEGVGSDQSALAAGSGTQDIRRGLSDLADHMDARLGSNSQNSQAGSFTLFVLTDGVRLQVTPSKNVTLITQKTTVQVNPGGGPAGVSSPGNSNNGTVGFSGKPGRGRNK